MSRPGHRGADDGFEDAPVDAVRRGENTPAGEGGRMTEHSRALPMVAAGFVAALVAGCAPAAPAPMSATTTPSASSVAASGPGAAANVTAPTATPSPSPVSASATSAARAEPACTAEDLSARETFESQVMNQPFSEVAVLNTGRHACTLDGYPRIAAAWAATVSSTGAESSGEHRVAVRVLDAGSYEVVDPGPRLFSVPPGGRAWFALGTTDSQPPWERFIRLVIAPAGSATGMPVRVTIVATAAPAVGMSVTAFAPGPPPRP